jgi:hypothetical protein
VGISAVSNPRTSRTPAAIERAWAMEVLTAQRRASHRAAVAEVFFNGRGSARWPARARQPVQPVLAVSGGCADRPIGYMQLHNDWRLTGNRTCWTREIAGVCWRNYKACMPHVNAAATAAQTIESGSTGARQAKVGGGH